MAEIARVLRERAVPFVDRGLDWAHAIFAAYEQEIRTAICSGKRPVLIELREIPPDALPDIDVIDHHGKESGHLPTSLEQVLMRLGIDTLTREQSLIAANDRGYIEGMCTIGASPDEIARIRLADRQAQGITAEQEVAAESAIAARTSPVSGLVIVKLPHDKTATVTDRLSALVGGPGYRSLLIESPNEVTFFGCGVLIERLDQQFGGYCGGQLPLKGYWGSAVTNEKTRTSITDFVIESMDLCRN